MEIHTLTSKIKREKHVCWISSWVPSRVALCPSPPCSCFAAWPAGPHPRDPSWVWPRWAPAGDWRRQSGPGLGFAGQKVSDPAGQSSQSPGSRTQPSPGPSQARGTSWSPAISPGTLHKPSWLPHTLSTPLKVLL